MLRWSIWVVASSRRVYTPSLICIGIGLCIISRSYILLSGILFLLLLLENVVAALAAPRLDAPPPVRGQLVARGAVEAAEAAVRGGPVGGGPGVVLLIGGALALALEGEGVHRVATWLLRIPSFERLLV